MRRNMLSRSTLLLSAFMLLSSCPQDGNEALPPSPENLMFPLTVRAEIDGRSELRIQGRSIWWHHIEFEAPGMWGDDQPTFLNQQEWWPAWPMDELIHCNCDSSKEELLGTPLNADGSTISLSAVTGRGTAQIVQQPNAGNGFTASIEFNDPLPDRAWITVTISQN